MSKITTKLHFMGKEVDDMTREEAIEAIKLLAYMLKSTRNSFDAIRKIDHSIDDLCSCFQKFSWGGGEV